MYVPVSGSVAQLACTLNALGPATCRPSGSISRTVTSLDPTPFTSRSNSNCVPAVPAKLNAAVPGPSGRVKLTGVSSAMGTAPAKSSRRNTYPPTLPSVAVTVAVYAPSPAVNTGLPPNS